MSLKELRKPPILENKLGKDRYFLYKSNKCFLFQIDLWVVTHYTLEDAILSNIRI